MSKTAVFTYKIQFLKVVELVRYLSTKSIFLIELSELTEG